MAIVANLETLADQVRVHREHKGITQKKLADELGHSMSRTTIAHLEQARKLPHDPNLLRTICEHLEIPKPIWEPFLNENSIRRANFEATLKELVGEPISALNLDPTVIDVVEEQIHSLFSNEHSAHVFAIFNSVIIFYGIRPVTSEFFSKYFEGAFRSVDHFNHAVQHYLKDAIRLFSTFSEAYNIVNNGTLDEVLKPLSPNDIRSYNQRATWTKIQTINETHLPYLGYIAATRVKQEENERAELAKFLREMSAKKKETKFLLAEINEKTKRKMDSLLRKFNSKIENGLFSPLFHPDSELLEKEADFIAPKEGSDLDKMAETQKKAYRNLANYLTADFMDVYVATSMRSDADFVSVNRFVGKLFKHEEIDDLKLRYFDPTQSWIEDRVAKGLVY
jgi:transcriptional regulator with XRE-family HTH domain